MALDYTSAGVVVTLAVEYDWLLGIDNSDREFGFPNEQHGLLIGRAVVFRMNDDFIAGLCLGNGIFDLLKRFAVTDFDCCGR